MPTPIAAWYPDPHEPSRLRWWDGTTWTNWCRHHTPAADDREPVPSAPESSLVADSEPWATPPPEPAGPPPAPDAAAWPSIAPESYRVAPPWASSSTDVPEIAPEIAAAPTPEFAPDFAPEPTPDRVPAPALDLPPAPAPVAAHEPAPSPEPEPVPPDVEPARRAPHEVPAGAPSLGSSLLPPLEIPTSSFAAPPPMDAPPAMPRGGGSGGPLRAVLIFLVIVAIGGLGFALYSRGTLDGLIGSQRQASNDGVTVYEGDGYSVEVPSEWTKGPTSAEGVIGFLAPTDDLVQITSPPTKADAEIDVSNPATRAEVFDVLIRIMEAVRPDMRVLTRAPTSVAGAPGEKLTVTGTDPTTNQPYQSTGYLFVKDSRFFVIELMSNASGADAAVTAEFEKVVASWRFD